MKTLICNADVVLPKAMVRTNVLVDQGKIVSLDAPDTATADQRVDASGLLLMPGVIDDQVHFREPGLTHKEDLSTASRACAAGGITTYLEMPNTKPAAKTVELVEQKYERAAQVSLVNYGFYIGATVDNVEELKRATNIPGIKIFIGSSTGDLLVDDQQALERIFGDTKLPICAHCEDEATVRANAERLQGTQRVEDHSRIRDHQAAIIATKRAIDLAIRHRHRFHVLHVSTGAEVPLLAPAKPWVTAEVCPHHLFFSVEDYQRLGSLIQMNPSIKFQEDCEVLWKALLEGDIQVIATDHAPHLLSEKALPYPQSPSGLPAVENSLALMLHQASLKRCTYVDIASWMSDAPARVWGLVRKGRIETGYDADLVLVDPNLQRTIRNEDQWTKSKWSPWHGETLTGWPVMTWVHGRLVYDRGQMHEQVRGERVRCDHERGGYWSTHEGIGV